MLRTLIWLGAALALLVNLGCAAYAPPPALLPGVLPSRVEVTIESGTPFIFFGRTALAFSLRCPATSLTGLLGTTRGDTLQFVDIHHHQFDSDAPPGCWEMKRGRVVQDRAAPFLVTVAEFPSPRSNHRWIVAAVVVVVIAAIVLKFQKFGDGGDCTQCWP